MHLELGFTRVFGTVKNNLLLVFAMLGYNLVKLRHWHALRYLPDPWAQFLHEPDTTPAPPKPTRIRARRRANLLGDPPG
ncbi:hypothetical protein SAMN05421854_101881 [Amycolatopsis rubida]|uniref:Uncharacterized protein n=1 Tax=Amycolatopsis rubida TaxID=112413 RepID=A0A1I5F0C7_9PSEU|nr:hypothetical protein SAMN05421854_101881 [Amycolatopsis rubida]